MRIAVTGSNGFIGSGICRAAVDGGHTVLGISRSSTPVEDFGGEYLQADVSTADLSKAFEAFRPDAVVHAAGCASVAASLENPGEDFKGSVVPWANLLDSVRKSDVRPQIFFISSAAVYGNAGGGPLGEHTPPAPISSYGFHKQICEILAREFSECHSLSVTVLRFFSVFGPRQRRLLVWDIFRKIRSQPELVFDGTGEETRDYLSCADVAGAVAQLAGTLRPGGRLRILNLARGSSVSIREMCTTVARLAGCSKPVTFSGAVRAGDPAKWVADTRQLEKVIPSWKPMNLDISLGECLCEWQAQ